MRSTTFIVYATVTLTAVLVAYASFGAVVWVGTVSLPTAGILGAFIMVGLLVLASG